MINVCNHIFTKSLTRPITKLSVSCRPIERVQNAIVFNNLSNKHITTIGSGYGNQNCLLQFLSDQLLQKRHTKVIFNQNNRYIHFFNKSSAEKLWKGYTSVSNAGKKKGRGKGNQRRTAKNLNFHQKIGEGSVNMQWPGLTSPVTVGNEVLRQKKLPDDPTKFDKLHEARDRMGKKRIFKLDQLERGWSGQRLPGRNIGSPDPIVGEEFPDFNSYVLEAKYVSVMDGKLGRKRRLSIFAVTGNGNGVAGFALAKGLNQNNCIRIVKRRAAQQLIYVDRCDGHTVFHNFYTKYLYTKIYVERKPEGYGLVCHRAIREICKVLGIRNLYAKIDGSTNVQNVTKAFFLGLIRQKTHQQLADEKNLHVVEILSSGMPRILASPQDGNVRSKKDIPMDEELDYDLYTMEGNVFAKKPPFQPFYVKLPSYQRYLKKQLRRRNRPKILHQQLLEYGQHVSFLKEKYPECDRRLIV